MHFITLLPIDINDEQNTKFLGDPRYAEVLSALTGFYNKVGFNKPWIGYFAGINENEIVGTVGFKGQPENGKVEIAYGTYKNYQRQGIGTEICRQLVALSLQTDAIIRIMARTLPDNIASINVLKNNGFECLGFVYDEEDGNVLEWEYKKPNS